VNGDERRADAGQVWPTWPATPGIPIALEAWSRPVRSSTSLLRGATVIGAAFVLSRLLGLVREMILAGQFGTSGVKDALVAAFLIPDLLFLIIMAGSFGSAFIPVFAGFLGRGREEDAWRLASTVLTLAALTMLAAGILVFVFAAPLIDLIAGNLSPTDAALAADLMRVLLLSPVFLGLGIAAKGILEGHERFTLPALAPVVYNVAIVLGALLLVPRFGPIGVAIGVAAGAVGHLLIQVPGLIRAGMRFRPSLDPRTPGLAEVGRLLGPRLVGQAAFQLNFIAVYAFANALGEGPLSALNFAWLLLMLPHGVLALSISTVAFPAMARLYEQRRFPELRNTFARALRPLIFLSLPAAVTLFFFRTAIVQLLYQRGAFDAASTRLVADAVAFFAAGLVGYALVEVVTRAFYAMHDTRTPVIIGVAIVVANVALCALLVHEFGHAALAFSLSLTTTVEAFVLFAVLRGRFGGLGLRDAGWLMRVLVATIVMILVTALVAPWVTAATVPAAAGWPVRLAFLLYATLVVGACYLVVAYLLRIPELTQVVDQTAGRFPYARRFVGKTERTQQGAPANQPYA
jgi:putative peptidoglycan lipid II flippase